MHETHLARQRGTSLIGLLFWCALIGGAALVAMKLFPIYNEKWKAVAAMKSVANQPGIADMSPSDIRKFILKNFEISDLDTFDERNLPQAFKVLRSKTGGGRVMQFAYEIRRPFFGELDLVMKMNESINIPGAVDE
jgi:hypothetical protein